ncbi:MAG: hypothetical protein KatS3mg126_1843 [Lysobacteraceae bacterium]|nr:MAG: hypothetical protein KatS3mg126_1843 [Xanthomonadaceae bacterium]
MPWIFFALALGCLAVAMQTMSMGLALLMLLGTLGFSLAGALTLVSARIQARSQGGLGLNPVLERERLRREREAAGAAAAPRETQADDTRDRAEQA